jgi:hypothetical protein
MAVLHILAPSLIFEIMIEVVAEHPSILLFPNFLGHEDKQGSHDIPGVSFPQHNLHLPTCHDTRISNEAMEESLASRDVFISCLLMKHLHKFYNRANLPPVKLVWEVYCFNALPPSKSREISFWWRDCLKCLGSFKDISQ